MEVKSYRDLIVWQKAMRFVTDIYRDTECFPKTEQFGLIPQIRRAAISVPSNIAEGYGRNSTADYLRFLQIARGSIYEVETQLEIALNLNYLSAARSEKLNEQSDEISRMLNGLITKLKNN
ncbi:MAG: four helix bundle protein [Kiritimatiellales bacterium]